MDKLKANLRSKKYRDTHKKQLQDYNKNYNKNYWASGAGKLSHKRSAAKHPATPEQKMRWRAMQRAKQKNIPFDLAVEDIQIPTHCPILGIPLIQGKSAPQDNWPSLDRKIPELGYIKDNISVISFRANTIKNNASLEELQQLVAWLQSS